MGAVKSIASLSATSPPTKFDKQKKVPRTLSIPALLLLVYSLASIYFHINMGSSDDDPVVASYDVFLTDSEISRFVFQYLDRDEEFPYNDRNNQRPTQLRMKARTGIVEVDVPINTRGNYDVNKGLRYGEAMKKSRSSRDGGAYGMSGGFTAGGAAANSGGRVKIEGNGDVEVLDNKRAVDSASLMRTQSLGGRVKPAEEGDPVYMLATFKNSTLDAETSTRILLDRARY